MRAGDPDKPVSADTSHIQDMKLLLGCMHPSMFTISDNLIEGEDEGGVVYEGDASQGSLIASLGVTWRGSLRVMNGRWVLFHWPLFSITRIDDLDRRILHPSEFK